MPILFTRFTRFLALLAILSLAGVTSVAADPLPPSRFPDMADEEYGHVQDVHSPKGMAADKRDSEGTSVPADPSHSADDEYAVGDNFGVEINVALIIRDPGTQDEMAIDGLGETNPAEIHSESSQSKPVDWHQSEADDEEAQPAAPAPDRFAKPKDTYNLPQRPSGPGAGSKVQFDINSGSQSPSEQHGKAKRSLEDGGMIFCRNYEAL